MIIICCRIAVLLGTALSRYASNYKVVIYCRMYVTTTISITVLTTETKRSITFRYQHTLNDALALRVALTLRNSTIVLV